MTVITILLFLNIKFFHKYDKFGIWFGKKFQKYFSIKEPEAWQLTLGKEAMDNLVKAEKGEKYIEKKSLFEPEINKQLKFTKKSMILPIIFLIIVFIIAIDVVI